ncbi:MAG: TonB-dependent receptor [Proteobacteria bacterium]|nr:TonB-dependent receptor [Pseudomonadota bacterium]
MKPNHKLTCAIIAVLGAQSGIALAAPSDSLEIAEIVVTAQRRSENIQNVPITIQALSAETLSQINVSSFDDIVKYLPNVSLATNGPGQGNVFMRVLALGSLGTQSSGTIGGFPNVAVYLDEQSGQIPSRNLDILAIDLERVEVLEGPQGTLFGGGAQAGVLRYITNKPKLNKFEGSAEASYGVTAHGDPNTALSAVLNLPLINDKLALRAVIYSDDRGGYINNVPSTFTRRATDYGIYYAGYIDPTTEQYAPPPGSPVINNYAIAKNAMNPVKYQGMRASLLWQINDDWSVLLAQSYQNMQADGVFYQMPKGSEGQSLNPLEVTVFNDAFDKDKFSNTSLTINGKIGAMKAVYSGGYLVRTIDQVNDYTNYSRGVYADYYQCHGYYSGGTPQCFSPSATWRELEKNTHQSHEFRVSTPDEWRIRGVAGAFYEDFKITDDTAWSYKSVPTCVTGGDPYCFRNVEPAPGSPVGNPNPRNDNVAFFEDTFRSYTQSAFFASVDVDLIPKVLTFTAGTRHYDYKMDFGGTVVSSFGCFNYASVAVPGACHNGAVGWSPSDPERSAEYKGFKSRANLTWHITPDTMVYATWSQGYRPGGFNRSSGYVAKSTTELWAVGNAAGKTPGTPMQQFIKPLTVSPDELTNKEIGFKTEFFNHRIQLNGSLYQEDWKNVQSGIFNPALFGNTTFGVNGADYQVKGVELQLTARVTAGLTVIGSGSWNQSKQVTSPFLVNNNPESAHFGEQITSELGPNGSPLDIVNTFGAAGVPTAFSPPLQFNLRARYDWAMGDYSAFWQVGMNHVGHSFNNSNTDPSLDGAANEAAGIPVTTTTWRYEMPAYSNWDGSVGIAKDSWSVQIFGQNLTDENKSTFTSSSQFIKAEVPMRPRVLGLKFGIKF